VGGEGPIIRKWGLYLYIYIYIEIYIYIDIIYTYIKIYIYIYTYPIEGRPDLVCILEKNEIRIQGKSPVLDNSCSKLAASWLLQRNLSSILTPNCFLLVFNCFQCFVSYKFLIGLICLNNYLDRYTSKYTKFQPKWPILDPNRCILVNWPPEIPFKIIRVPWSGAQHIGFPRIARIGNEVFWPNPDPGCLPLGSGRRDVELAGVFVPVASLASSYVSECIT